MSGEYLSPRCRRCHSGCKAQPNMSGKNPTSPDSCEQKGPRSVVQLGLGGLLTLLGGLVVVSSWKVQSVFTQTNYSSLFAFGSRVGPTLHCGGPNRQLSAEMLLGKKKWRIRATLDRSTVSCPSSESSRDVSDQTSSQLRQCQTAAKGISVCVLRDPWSLTCQGSRSLWHSWPWQALGYTCSAHRWVLPINAQKIHSALPHTKWSGRSCIIFFCSNIILQNFDKLHPFVSFLWDTLRISCSCTGGWTPGLFGAS